MNNNTTKKSIRGKWNKFYGNLTVDDKVAISFALLTCFVFSIVAIYPVYIEPIAKAFDDWFNAHPFLVECRHAYIVAYDGAVIIVSITIIIGFIIKKVKNMLD